MQFGKKSGRSITMADKNVCVAIYATPALADEAFSRLQSADFGNEHLSFVGRDYWTDMVGSRSTTERFRYRGARGAFWERLWTLLSGWGVFCLYENGPLLVAGPLVRTILAAQDAEGVDRPADGFESGLHGLGIPDESIAQYKKALTNNGVLLFVLGSAEEIDRAQHIVSETKATNHTLHHAVAV
jgi:hypothetical protein